MHIISYLSFAYLVGQLGSAKVQDVGLLGRRRRQPLVGQVRKGGVDGGGQPSSVDSETDEKPGDQLHRVCNR